MTNPQPETDDCNVDVDDAIVPSVDGTTPGTSRPRRSRSTMMVEDERLRWSNELTGIQTSEQIAAAVETQRPPAAASSHAVIAPRRHLPAPRPGLVPS